MVQPSHNDLGIEIGKALAMAEMAQKAIQDVEKHLATRMDRLETKVDTRFSEMDKKFDSAVGEIKQLIQTQHNEITTIKIQSSHDEGEKHNRKESRSHALAIWALIISLVGAVANAFTSGVK